VILVIKIQENAQRPQDVGKEMILFDFLQVECKNKERIRKGVRLRLLFSFSMSIMPHASYKQTAIPAVHLVAVVDRVAVAGHDFYSP
jgi:hypothetical protein